MSTIVLIIALIVSIVTVERLLKLLRQMNRELDEDLETVGRRLEDLEAQMDTLEKLDSEEE